MKKALLSAGLLLLALAPAAAQSRIETITIPSALLGCQRPCSVYLPDGYDRSGESYPVLYLLHGASDEHDAWVKKGNMQQIVDETIAEGRAVPMVVVMPDASGEGEYHLGAHLGYFDVPGWPYERFFFEELIPAIESRYRIAGDKRNRAIAGLSMGGGGSAAYAQRHPDRFGAACPLSALLADSASGLRNNEPFIRSVRETSPIAFLETMTAEQAAQLRTVRWRVDCGDDDFLWEDNIRFYTLMRRNAIPLEFRMRDGGHTWRYWSSALPEVLTFISSGFGA